MDYIDQISDANALIESFRKAAKGSDWKESVQRYEMNLLRNTARLRRQLRSGEYRQMPFYEFTLCERGKVRPIRSMHISDRVVQRSVCDNALIPALQPYLIYDNGASLKDKGVDFARRRLDTHLRKFYREHGADGYILLIDFSKFFDNVPHRQLISSLEEKVGDERLMELVRQMIDAFALDVSYMSTDEYEAASTTPINLLDHYHARQNTAGEKILHKSLGIGAQVSQICGVYYPTPIDNYCKIVRGHRFYGRYMDDIYIIDQDKARLRETLQGIRAIADTLGLYVNPKKTQIVKISHGFTWLKIRYSLTDTGRVVKRLSRKRITRERRRLKKFRKLCDEGRMPYKDIENAYRSWRGGAKKYCSRRTIRNMDALFNELFITDFLHERRKS